MPKSFRSDSTCRICVSTKRERDGRTERQTDRQAETERDTERKSETSGERERGREERETEWLID